MQIEVNNLTKKFGKKKALDGLSLSIEEGVYGLLGPNGAGKTTLMCCLLGVYNSNSGSIVVNGKADPKGVLLSAHCGYLPQHFDMFHELTVTETLRYFATLKKIPRAKGVEEIGRCLRTVNLEEEAKKRVGALSGGMRRRLGIAQALLGDPPLLIFDEPTAGLDPEERMRFKNIIAAVRHRHTILISTHIVDDIDVICNRVMVINRGKLCAQGTKEDICRCADGRVFTLPREQEGSLNRPYYLENIFEAEGQEHIRILSQIPQPVVARPAAPTLEDGYFALVRGEDL